MNGWFDVFEILRDTRYPISLDRWDGEGVGCRMRGHDETSCHSHDDNRITLSDTLLGHSDGPIARRRGRR